MEQLENKDNSKVIVQVNHPREDEDEIDLLNVFAYMGRKKKLVAYLLVLAILIGSTLGVLYSATEHIFRKGSYARAMVTFQFEGIDKGLDPNGASFDVNILKSPYVIQGALNSLGIGEGYVEAVRRNFEIQGVIPKDAVERLSVINKMAETKVENYEKLLDVSYFPSQYIIYLYDDGTFGAKELAQILDAVIDSYKQYFLDTYGNTQVLTVTSNLLDGGSYDYAESVNLVETQIDIMLSYVNERLNEAPDFRSSQTGLSFEDIVTALEFVNTVDIARLSSFVESNSLTKDRDKQIVYYEYLIRETSNKISEYETQLETVNNAIATYEKDPVVVVSGADSTLEYGEKNENYDQLVNQRLSLTSTIAGINTRLNKYYLVYNRLKDSTKINTQADFDYADSLLANLDSTISSWVDLIETTTEEYYSTTLFSNAVKVSVPAQYFIDGGISHIVKNMAIPSAGLVVIVFIWWFSGGVKKEIAKQRKEEQ